ncbi:MAG: hypothetical protein GY803_12495 [Chloroflexi bacterium]|nr:hypothetical protein [Chloroflexota bacterium]
MTKTIDSLRFLPLFTRRLVKSWIARATPQEIPWTPLTKSLKESTVALISTGGLALKTDRPFDQEGERRNPWWGDPTFRVIPSTATHKEVTMYHLHLNPRFSAEDLNCLFPLQRLLEFAERGEIGRSAVRHYSFMGYIIQPQRLLEESVPAMIASLKEDGVDTAVLIPA